MKKTYEKPVLKTEPFDTENVITASSPNAAGLSGRNAIWEIPFDPAVIPFH